MKLLAVFIVVSLVHSTDTFVVATYSTIMKIPINVLASKKNIHRILVILLTKIVFLAVGIIIFRHFRRFQGEWKQNVFILLNFSIIAISGGLYLQITARNLLTVQVQQYLLAATIGIWVMGITTYFLNCKIIISEFVSLENERLKQMQAYQENEVQKAKEHYEAIISIHHDMNNHLQAISSMLNDNCIAEAQSYLQKVTKSISITESVHITTQSKELNATLNPKLEKLSQQGADVKCIIEDELLGISIVDLCTILGNLLDNVIEANEKLEQHLRKVQLYISAEKGCLHIQVKNHIETSVLTSNPRLYTNKSDKSLHGVGHRSVEICVCRLGGFIDYYEKNSMFCCSILIPAHK